MLWWCWEAQEFGELGKLGERRVRRKGQVREGKCWVNTRGRGANRIAGGSGSRDAGDPHRPIVEGSASVRKRGPPREAGGEGAGCPGEFGVGVLCVSSLCIDVY